MNSNLTPLVIVTGRNTLQHDSATLSHHLSWNHTDQSDAAKYFRRVVKLNDLRASYVKLEAAQMLKVALSNSLRKGATLRYKPGDSIHAWNPKTCLRENGFRLLSESGRNAILERGRHLANAPVAWIRLELNVDSIVKQNGHQDAPSTAPSGECKKSERRPIFVDKPSSSSDVPVRVSPTESPSRSVRKAAPPVSLLPSVSATRTAQILQPFRRYNLRSQYRCLMSEADCENDNWAEAGAAAILHSEDASSDSEDVAAQYAELQSGKDAPNDKTIEDFIDAYGCVDLSRIPPRIMIKEPHCAGIFEKGVTGHPPNRFARNTNWETDTI